LHTKNELFTSRLSKVRALQTDRQTDRQTDTQTDVTQDIITPRWCFIIIILGSLGL